MRVVQTNKFISRTTRTRTKPSSAQHGRKKWFHVVFETLPCQPFSTMKSHNDGQDTITTTCFQNVGGHSVPESIGWPHFTVDFLRLPSPSVIPSHFVFCLSPSPPRHLFFHFSVSTFPFSCLCISFCVSLLLSSISLFVSVQACCPVVVSCICDVSVRLSQSVSLVASVSFHLSPHMSVKHCKCHHNYRFKNHQIQYEPTHDS